MSDHAAANDATVRRFRRGLYLSLGLACGCLAYAEWPFLPQMLGLSAVVAVLMVTAYFLEGRWALSIRQANIVGAVIAVGAAGWVAYQFFRPLGTLLDVLPWPASLMPYLGPLVLVLIP